MPSASLLRWQKDRMLRLGEVGSQCALAAALVPPNALLAEELLRGYAMLLSGHFQGLCRDLYTECVQVFASRVPPPFQAATQSQFSAELRLSTNNPTVETIRTDVQRFGFVLDFHAIPANGPRVTHLGHLNKWRNAIAHQKATAPTGIPPLTLVSVEDWRASCDGLAVWLDGIMQHEVHQVLGTSPW